MSKWYYVVFKGIAPGVYENWEENDEWCCLEEWCCHKKFLTVQEATAKFNESLRKERNPHTTGKEPIALPGSVESDRAEEQKKATTNTTKRPRSESK